MRNLLNEVLDFLSRMLCFVSTVINNKSLKESQYLFISLLRAFLVEPFHRMAISAHDRLLLFYTRSWSFNPRSHRVTDRLRRVRAMQRTETHICIYACVYNLSMHGCRCGTHSPASVIFFPTLVMAGIVNSIASELDAVSALRKRSGPSNAA